MKYPPCQHCGATYHAPYDDGLVECIANLENQRDEAIDEMNGLLDLAAAFLFWTPPTEKAWRDPYEMAEKRVALEKAVARLRPTSDQSGNK